MLLDAFALPCCAALSYCFLGVRYTRRHLFGVLLCVVGLVLNVISDTLPTPAGAGAGAGCSSGASSYPNALRGDVCVLVAACLYAVSNVAQEKLVKHYDRVEFLGMLGTWGTFVCVCILLLLERNEVSILLSSRMDYVAFLELTGFVLCLFVMYCVTSKFLQEGDALLFNLSTLTSDVYGALFAVLLFHTTPHWLYGVAFVSVALGIVVYGKGGVEAEKENDEFQQAL